MLTRIRASRCRQLKATGMNNLPVLRTPGQPENTSPRSELSRTGPDPVQESPGQKVMRKACDNFLHYELNLNRALARETRGSSGAGASPAADPTADVAAAKAALDAMGVLVGTSQARRRADVVTPGGVAAPTPP